MEKELSKEVYNIVKEKESVEKARRVREFIKSQEELEDEGKISDYSVVYRSLKSSMERGDLEVYLLERAGDFLSSLVSGEYKEAVLRADLNNSASLARADPENYVKAIEDKFGKENLNENVKVRLPRTMHEDEDINREIRKRK